MSKRKKGFPTVEESIKLFSGMTPAQRRAMERISENRQYNAKNKQNYAIEPYTGQKGFRFNKGGIVGKVKQAKYF
jgi:hypothetical protein|tara:strand:+ start:283 stop:507 length:225 start_codon:yes stop_codon:yes gene_type:complete